MAFTRNVGADAFVRPGERREAWQITPQVLTEVLAAGGAVAKRALEAMMPKKKI